MDTAVSVLQSIYDVYKTIKDGQEQFAETYDRMKALLGQLQSMEDTDTLVQTEFLDKYLVLARDFLAYLKKYSQRKFLSKVFHQSEMLAEVEGFNQQLEALFQHFHLAMGSHIVEHNRNQEASMDELVRGMRVLLQGANAGHLMKTMQSSDDLLGSTAVLTSGPIAKALNDGDVGSLLGFLHDVKLGDGAAMALSEMAEKDEGRDAMVEAGAVLTLLEKISAARPSAESTVRVHAARTIRRLAVRDVYEVAIVEAGAVGRLASLVDASPVNSDAEVAAACAALANLTFQPQHKLVMLETPHLLARLVELVRSGSDAQKKHAINVLRELATNDECANAIRKAQGITVLVDLLHIGSAEQCASALSVLWTMASQEKNRSEIASVGGINAIVAQIRRSSSDDAQRQLAASTLAVLAQDDANDSLIGETDGVELLVNLLRTGTEGQKNSAAWALAELANDAENAAAMMRLGVAPALMAAFRSGTDIQRSKAGLALVWIAQLTEDKAALVNEIGLSSIVSLLRGSIDQKQNAAGIIEGIAKDEKIQQQLGQLGAIDLLIDLVKSHSPKINGVKALRALAMDNEDHNNENPELISCAGGVEVLVDVLKKLVEAGNASTDETFQHVLDALSTVSENASRVLARVIDAGGLPILLETMETGALSRKRRVAVLLNEFSSDLPDEDESNSLAACTRALVQAAQPVEGEPLDNKLTATVMSALWSIASKPLGRSILVDQESGIQLLISLLTSTLSNENKKTAGYALGNLTSDEEMAKRVISEGVLDVYHSLLSSKSAKLQFTALYGLTQLAAYSECRKKIVETPGMCTRIIKLLTVGAEDEVVTRAAWTLHVLTEDTEIAAELGPVHGLEALVALVQTRTGQSENGYHDLNQSFHSAATLRNLARVPENIEILTEIGAIDAAVTLLDDDVAPERGRTAALEMLELMSTNREASEAIIASGSLIAHCVARLQHADVDDDDDDDDEDESSGEDEECDDEEDEEDDEDDESDDEEENSSEKDTEEVEEQEEEADRNDAWMARDHAGRETDSWPELCLTILLNINELQMTEDPDLESSESDESEEENDEHEDDEGGENDGDEVDDDGEEEEVGDSFLEQIVEAGGITKLMEILEERSKGKRAGLIKLLNELAASEKSSKIRIGGSVTCLVEIVGEGTDVEEQIAAAEAIVTLVEGSKRNAGAAIRARVGEAFVELLKANADVGEASKVATVALITNLTALKSVEATAAVRGLLKSLVSEAVADAKEGSVAVFDVLEELLGTASFVKTFVNTGAVVTCCEAMKAQGSKETKTRAVVLLSKVSRTKYRKKLLENGVVDVFMAAMKETPQESGFTEAAQRTLQALGARAY